MSPIPVITHQTQNPDNSTNTGYVHYAIPMPSIMINHNASKIKSPKDLENTDYRIRNNKIRYSKSELLLMLLGVPNPSHQKQNPDKKTVPKRPKSSNPIIPRGSIPQFQTIQQPLLNNKSVTKLEKAKSSREWKGPLLRG